MTLRSPLLAALVAAAMPAASADKPKKPSLELRASPRVALVPGPVVFTGELRGGEDGDALHCLTVAWDWGDGTESEQGAEDCGPWTPGTPVERRYTVEREFREEGRPTVTLRLLKDGREVARDTVRLIVQKRGRNGLKVRTPGSDGTMGSDEP